jgi:hypothetical protein
MKDAMLIKMIHTRRGTENGFLMRLYRAGHVYDVADMLASAFLYQKAAVRVPHQAPCDCEAA